MNNLDIYSKGFVIDGGFIDLKKFADLEGMLRDLRAGRAVFQNPSDKADKRYIKFCFILDKMPAKVNFPDYPLKLSKGYGSPRYPKCAQIRFILDKGQVEFLLYRSYVSSGC